MKSFEDQGCTVISRGREGISGLRLTTSAVLFFFLWGNIHPAIAAVKSEIENPTQAKAAPAVTKPDKHAQSIEALTGVLEDIRASAKKSGAGLPAARLQQVQQIAEALNAEDQDVLAEFQKNEAHIKAKKLPKEILDRHSAAVAQFKANRQKFQSHLKALALALTPTAADAEAQALQGLLEQWKPVKPKFDPNNLPFRTNDPKVRVPAETEEALKNLLKRPAIIAKSATPAEIAAALSPDQRKQGVSATELALIEAENHPYELDRGKVQIASLGALSAIPPPGPEFLTPTEDIQITPEIQAKALELHNNPVEIYNWVRNNIEWLPSYGSIQGSQMTLDKKQGNAFDTASLLMALLRSSGIPARYVYGTVDIPVDKLQNWIGGTTNPDAAQNIMGQGGIPNVGLTKGGQTAAIRMEHVWVEAWVDFYPSRGAKNIQGDTWVPMDASFKQYTYTEGLDLNQAVPFDAESFLNQAQQGATVNEQEGYVQNLNQQNIQAQLTSYQTQLQNYINSQNPNATVGEVLGAKTIQQVPAPHLAASLPYSVKVTGNRYATLPTSLRHQFRYSLYLNSRELALENPLLTFQDSTPNLASKKITLSFIPATESDRETIESYLPKPHEDGSPIQPEEFPSSLPAYNIRVKAELRVEGTPVATSDTSYTLGTEFIGEGGFTTMNLAGYDLTQDAHIAGQSSALGLSLFGVSSTQLGDLQRSLSKTNEALRAARLEELQQIGGEQVIGDLLALAIHYYLASIDSFEKFANAQEKIIDFSGLSFGFLHAQFIPKKQYGVATSVRFSGALMDVGHIRSVCYARDNKQTEWSSYNRVRGEYSSAMEFFVPQQFFDDPSDQVVAQGMSAVKALSIAAEEGQRIYTLDKANIEFLSDIQQSAAVKDYVRNAVASGKIATLHESPISYGGFTGAGYIVLDPQTGAGGFLIEGGFNGGAISYSLLCLATVLLLATPFISLLVISPLAGLVSAVFAARTLVDLIDGVGALQDAGASETRLSAYTGLYAFSASLGFFLAGAGIGALNSPKYREGSLFLSFTLIQFIATKFFGHILLP